MPTIKELLRSSLDMLAHLETPLLDSEVLLSHLLGKPREFLHAHPEHLIDEAIERACMQLILRRATHEPVAYLTNTKAFYGRNFYVDAQVHIPRPATEDLVEYVKQCVGPDFSGHLADIGTGSGCIAITLALEFPRAKITATDLSEAALKVAERNAHALGARINFYCGDLLAALPEKADIIVSNPPYGWPNGWSEDKEIAYQPTMSYESGSDGLSAIQTIINNLPAAMRKNGQAFIEHDPRQSARIKNLAQTAGFACEIAKDLSDWDRIAKLTSK